MNRHLLTLVAVLTVFNCLGQEDLIKANNDFSLRLFRSIKTDSADFFISPFGLHMALSIVNEGAGSGTRSEIDRLLGLESTGDRAQSYSSLIDKTTDTNDAEFRACNEWTNGNESDKNELTIANSLWLNGRLRVNPTFEATAKKNYKADVFQLSEGDGGEEMTRWVSKATDNKISRLPPLDPDAKLTVVDVVHFKGVWEHAFEKKKTKARKFRTIKQEKVELDFMRQQGHYRYYEDDDIQAIQLPYRCDQFSMVVILPREKYDILKVEEKLTAEYIDRIVKVRTRTEVILSLPKFKIESEIFPKEELEVMGYTQMFSDNADFSGISVHDSLKIGRIIHKTFITVDEKQTEAAAASLLEMVVVGYGGGDPPPPPPPPKIFDADHPFVFLIFDNRTGAILFVGRLADPVSVK